MLLMCGKSWEDQEDGFTLNPEKVTLGAMEIKYLGHLLSSRGIWILPDRIAIIQRYPRPTNLEFEEVHRYGRFLYPVYSGFS